MKIIFSHNYRLILLEILNLCKLVISNIDILSKRSIIKIIFSHNYRLILLEIVNLCQLVISNVNKLS